MKKTAAQNDALRGGNAGDSKYLIRDVAQCPVLKSTAPPSGKPVTEPDLHMLITEVVYGKKELAVKLTRVTITLEYREPASATKECGGAVLN